MTFDEKKIASHISGKRILLTGATDGIGRQTALDLAKMGAEVLLHGRDRTKGESLQEEIRNETGNDAVSFFQADFASLREVRRLADAVQEQYDRLDVLINNAGVYMKKRQLSEDGFEMTFAVNHLAPFLLTLSLLDLMKQSAPSRIVNVSSMAHASNIDFENLQGDRHYDGYRAYSLSKLCMILFTFRLSQKLEGSGVTVNCLHPGVIDTKLLRTAWRGSGGSPEEGAQNEIYAAGAPELEGVSGKYFVDSKESKPASVAFKSDIQDRLWQVSEEAVQPFPGKQ